MWQKDDVPMLHRVDVVRGDFWIFTNGSRPCWWGATSQLFACVTGSRRAATFS